MESKTKPMSPLGSAVDCGPRPQVPPVDGGKGGVVQSTGHQGQQQDKNITATGSTEQQSESVITIDDSQPEVTPITTRFSGQTNTERLVNSWKSDTWGRVYNSTSGEQPSRVNVTLANIFQGTVDQCRAPLTQETLTIKKEMLNYKGEHKRDIIMIAAKIEEIVQTETRSNLSLKLAILIEEQTKRMFDETEIKNREMNKYLDEIEAHTKETRTRTEIMAFCGLKKLMDSNDKDEIQRQKELLFKKLETAHEQSNQSKFKLATAGVNSHKQLTPKTNSMS